MLGIIDYGMGNLGSVTNACRYLELPCRVITKPTELAGCDAAVLPGVGAFADCMKHLGDHGFIDPIKAWISDGKPFLGICLGLQVLFADSEESPGVPGLGILPGRVRRFTSTDLKIPQIGWNKVKKAQPDCPLFQGVPDEAFFYFVHSFHAETPDTAIVAGVTEYGVAYPSMVWRDNIMAVQFHPEKSQKVGLRMLQNFGDWAFEKTRV